MIEPYLPFVLSTLEKYPHLTASRLYHMVRERGYQGGPDHFRHLIAVYRPQHAAEAYLRLRTLPGEECQVDWAHFDFVQIGRAKRPLMAFVIVLSYSRKIFLQFYFNHRLANFLRGHVAAFTHWGGVPRVCLYDNLKSVTLERQGDAIRFNPNLLDFAAYYRYEPRPVAVARGNEKGRVERAIRYARTSFFAARQWQDINDLNAQALQWCDEQASDRPCPEDRAHTVREIFQQEQPTLMALPDNPYPVDEHEAVRVGKTPYVRFDLNDYSVPHTYVRCTLSVVATLDTVTILDGCNTVAEHTRSFGKGQQIEQEDHIKALVDIKKRARHHRGQDRLIRAAPCCSQFLQQAAEKCYSLRSVTRQLLKLLDEYGAADLEAAIKEALARHVPHPNAVRISLVKRREQRQQPPPVPLDLPKDARVRNLVVRPHRLDTYDQLQQPTQPRGDDNDNN